MARRIHLLLLAATCTYAQWPTPKSAADAVDFVQARRIEAEKLWTAGDARGFTILNDALAYLDQPLVRDLAAGNVYLEVRRSNIYLDFAEAYAMQGKTRESTTNLQKFADLLAIPAAAQGIEQNRHFDSVRSDPGYKAAIATLKRFELLWESEALGTKFSVNISAEEKLAGLSKFWSEVKYNFAYPEKLIELDWDKLYLQAIPKVMASKSTAEYYQELMRLCALLRDGHTNVNAPDQLNSSLARPPLRTALIEGHVMILDGRSPSLEARGVTAGTEILEVDGVAATTYAQRDVAPYQSSSTPQDLENRTYWYGFLRGPADQLVRLKLRAADGKEFEASAERKGYTDVRRTPPFEWRMLPQSNIAYVALNDFSTNDLVKAWREAFPQLLSASALILDLRLNGGGSSNIGYEVLRSLVDHPVLGSRQVMRPYNPTDRAHGFQIGWTVLPAEEMQPREGPHYTGPVAVLAGPATFSAAEDFLVAWKNSGRGKLIGEPSGGSTGQPLSFKLPGGGSARVCTKRDTFPDGTEWVGKGIAPDILVRPTVADVRAKRDTVLERAIEIVKAESR
jgi:C-terminal processing protease CtpA/Prc